MKKNIIRKITILCGAYFGGRLIGGLWAYTNPDKAKKLYNGFVRLVRRETEGFVDGFHRGYNWGYSVTTRRIPECEVPKDIVKAAIDKAVAAGNVVMLDDID